MDDAKRGEFWKIETFGNHLSANNNIEIAGMNLVVDLVETLIRFSIGVKTGNISMRKEAMQLILDGFGAKTFVMNAGIVALWARGWNREATAASVAAHLKLIGMQYEWQETVVAKRLPAALIANGKRCGTAAIMKNQALSVVLE